MHTRKRQIGYAIQQLATSARLSSHVRYFTIYQLGYALDLSETRVPLFHDHLLLTIPWKNIEISSPYFLYASGFISVQSLNP